jgi:hypothetical protein
MITISACLVLFVTPLLVLFWRLPKGTSRISWRRFIAGVACGWLLLNLHRRFIELPVLFARFRERHQADPNYFWDPVSGNVITFVFSWIPVLLVTAVYSLAAYLWCRLRKHHA